MAITEFEKQKEALIRDIIAEVKEEKDLEFLIRQFNRIAKITTKPQKKTTLHPNTIFKNSVLDSIENTKTFSHEEALQETYNMIDKWR